MLKKGYKRDRGYILCNYDITFSLFLSPFTNKGHQTSTNIHTDETNKFVDERTLTELHVMIDFTTHQRDISIVQQNTS